jgi:putative addiction module antidote
MSARLTKVGNSVSVRLPKAVLSELKLEAGDTVDIVVAKRQIVLKPVRPAKGRKRVTLQQLLRDLKPEHLQPEVDWGTAVGNEFR